MEAPSPRSRRTLLGLSVPLGIVLSGLFVWQASHAAFTATTVNEANRWEAGEVSLEDDATDTAMFSGLGLLSPGDRDSRCITVTYGGSLDAEIGLYVADGDLSGDLADHLDFEVELGSGGGFGDCSGFSSEESLYTGTLSGLAAAHTHHGDGLGPWRPTGGSGEARTYRFTYELRADDGAQGKTADATFTWEARTL